MFVARKIGKNGLDLFKATDARLKSTLINNYLGIFADPTTDISAASKTILFSFNYRKLRAYHVDVIKDCLLPETNEHGTTHIYKIVGTLSLSRPKHQPYERLMYNGQEVYLQLTLVQQTHYSEAETGSRVVAREKRLQASDEIIDKTRELVRARASTLGHMTSMPLHPKNEHRVDIQSANYDRSHHYVLSSGVFAEVENATALWADYLTTNTIPKHKIVTSAERPKKRKLHGMRPTHRFG